MSKHEKSKRRLKKAFKAPGPSSEIPQSPHLKPLEAIDIVDETSLESFPASDSPAWTSGEPARANKKSTGK